MRQRFSRLVLALAIALTVIASGVTLAQTSPSAGGVFEPLASYVVQATYTFIAASPLKFEGATNDSKTTTIAVTDPTANRTITLPDATLLLPSASGGVPAHFDCGSTGSGSQTCAPATAAATSKVFSGRSTLAASAATITFPTAFTATTSFECIANDVTTRANPVQMVPASTTTATITNTTGATDVIQWICAGS